MSLWYTLHQYVLFYYFSFWAHSLTWTYAYALRKPFVVCASFKIVHRALNFRCQFQAPHTTTSRTSLSFFMIMVVLNRFPFNTFMLINCFFMQLTHSLICCYYCYYHLVLFFIHILSFVLFLLLFDVMIMMMLLMISRAIQAVNGRWPL